jgi:hypothetical protein
VQSVVAFVARAQASREAQSEYAGYSGTLGRLLRAGASADELATFLGDAETHMGLAPNKDLDRLVATKLIDWYGEEMRGT